MPRNAPSDVLTIRVPRDVALRLAREARRQRRTKSQVARAMLMASLDRTAPEPDPQAEAERQSRLASRRPSDAEALRFAIDAADLRGWK